MIWFTKSKELKGKTQLKSKDKSWLLFRYLNHINLLKLIKQDIEQEKIKFKERTQGAEISLFIENIFTLNSKENKTNPDLSSPEGLVKNVIEKKLLIEKLQEKMSQRLEIFNQLLANHAIRQSAMNINNNTPNIIKNSIKLINPNLGKALIIVI